MDKKLFIVAKREYLERVRSRWFIVMTLAVPALLSAAMVLPIYMSAKGGTTENVRRIRILDATGKGVGERVAATIRADSSTRSDTVTGPTVVATTPAELVKLEQQAIQDVMKPKSLVGVLVLTDSTLAGQSVRYSGRNASSITEVDKLEAAVRQSVMMVRLQGEGVKQQTVDDLSKMRVHLSAERISDRGRGGSGITGILVGVVFGAMLLMSIIVHGQNVMRGVLEEKTTRVAEVVLSSLKPDTLLAGKVVGVGAVGLTQVIAWLGLSAYLANFLFPIVLKSMGGAAAASAGAAGAINGPGSMFGALSLGVFAIAIGYFVLGFVFYSTLYAAVGSMVNSEQEAQQAAMPVMLLLMSGWIFLNPILINPNSTLAVVLSWLPWTSPIIMPIRMGLTTVAPLSVAGSMVCAAAGSLAAVWLAARIYRVGMLMYGKKPSFGEVVKWVRYA
jgi:ABC-2 type transport system permease protein